MSGWLALLLLLFACLGLLWALGVRSGLLQLCAAALLFGAAGYALQGHPGLGSAAATAAAEQPPIPLTRLRHAFFGQFTGAERWLVISESYARRGRTADAAGVLRSAVREHPRNIALWVGLGNALVDHSGGLTPAALVAFDRAIRLAPQHPAPRFFLGLAFARSGARGEALALWQGILAEAPADASWRPVVEDAMAAIDRPARASQGSEQP